MYTPEIEAITNSATGGYLDLPRTGGVALDPELLASCRTLHRQVVSAVRPSGSDQQWSLWLRSERGPVSAFGDYGDFLESGEVESREEFGDLWRALYPHDPRWHRATLQYYNGELFVGLDRWCAGVALDRGTVRVRGQDCGPLLGWLVSSIRAELGVFSLNPREYNEYIRIHLPPCKRFGKIRRETLWKEVEGMERLDDAVGAESLGVLEEALGNPPANLELGAMTAGRYFEICETCYDANGYFPAGANLAAREKYRHMSDGRDGGLSGIAEDSPEAFAGWFERDDRFGAHPWEICRGGNRTHISLAVLREGRNAWRLHLAGSSRSRAVETARMAVALARSKVPFALMQGEEILRMLKGIDLVGVVPEAELLLQYSGGAFPDEDRIIDFINPWHDRELSGVVKEHATWYEAERLEPVQ